MVKRHSYIYLYENDRAIATTQGPMLKKKKRTGAVVERHSYNIYVYMRSIELLRLHQGLCWKKNSTVAVVKRQAVPARLLQLAPRLMLKKKITGAVVKRQAVPARLLQLAPRLMLNKKKYMCCGKEAGSTCEITTASAAPAGPANLRASVCVLF